MRRFVLYGTTVLVALVALARPTLAADDIVLYATDAATVRGNWSRVADASAAGGQLLTSANSGWSATDSALAAPADYFELTFAAPANMPYRLWIHLRAVSNSKYNDSVYAQFSDAVDTDGSALYRVGTTSGLKLNLQSCNGCALSGWGWLDGAYWLQQTSTVLFAAGGSHTLRIQTREDGVQVDQVVLSPGTYLNDAPGQAMNDSTIVAKPSAPPPQSSGSTVTGLSPYSGSATAVPGTIDAATFDNGGEGVAYHDTTTGNSGGAYRSTDVDIEPSSEGGYDVGWTAAGEWLNYTVNVAAAGSYVAQLRVASPSGASMHLGFNNASSVWADVSVPSTGGWQTWTTVEVPVTLGAGVQQMTLLFDTPGVNIRSVAVSGSGGGSPSSSGNTITVPAGGDLQAAINASQPGDTILLVPGATYRGIFNLPAKDGSDYITIRSAAADASLPGDGVRITPSYQSQLPLVLGGVAGAPAFTTSPGAHHFRLQFLEIASTYAWNQIIELGDASSPDASLVPHDLVIDRCYIHGDPTNGQKRGIALNSASTWIVNSYISDIKSDQEDSQAIANWNGPGPFTIENNYLEAAGENVLFGGGDPAIANLVPSDISFRFNYVTKNLAWRGTSWTVKNLLELKNAQRVVIDSNVFENNWAADQSGHAILLTPRNQDGSAWWVVVQQIQFTNNVVRHVSSAFNILGVDNDGGTTTVTNTVTVRNNLFDDISASSWGGAGQLVLTQGGSDIVFDHNTVFTDGSSVVYADVTTVPNFVFTNNILPDNAWAVMGGNTGEGNDTLDTYYPGATFRGNVIVGANAAVYPSGNFFPSTTGDVGFLDLLGENYRLSASSPYRTSATDGTAVGCNMDALRP
jgi:Carbohydrate binding module (family 6)